MAKLWSKHEFERLRKLYPNTSTQDLTQQINRPYHAINKMASRIGIKKKVRIIKKTQWPEEQIKILQKIYPTTETWRIANQLDRPVSAVRRKAKEMGLKRARRRY